MNQLFPDINNWPFAATVKSKFCEVDYRGNDFSNKRKLGALTSAWGEFSDLSVVRCKACNGFGHTWRACPTAKRITAIARTSLVVRNRVAQAKTDHVVGQAAHR